MNTGSAAPSNPKSDQQIRARLQRRSVRFPATRLGGGLRLGNL